METSTRRTRSRSPARARSSYREHYEHDDVDVPGPSIAVESSPRSSRSRGHSSRSRDHHRIMLEDGPVYQDNYHYPRDYRRSEEVAPVHLESSRSLNKGRLHVEERSTGNGFKGVSQMEGNTAQVRGSFRSSSKRSWQWIVSSKCVLVLTILLIVFTLAVSLSKLAMGIIYMNDCPMEVRIPIYLVVSGCTMFVFAGFLWLRPSDSEGQVFEEKLTHYAIIVGFLGLLFYFVWLICGSVWLSGNYNDAIGGCNGSTNCCEKDLMHYTLAVTVIDWIFFAITLLTVLLTACLMYCSRTANK